jgi:hypothetical protein
MDLNRKKNLKKKKKKTHNKELKRAEKAKRKEKETYKTMKRPTPRLGYYFLNGFLGTFIFLMIYFGFLLPLYGGIVLFFGIFVANLASGLTASMIARGITGNYEKMKKHNQQIYKAIIGAFLYALVVFLGLMAFILGRYVDINTLTIGEFFIYMFSKEFIEVVVVLIVIKLLVVLMSDTISDKLSFGG